MERGLFRNPESRFWEKPNASIAAGTVTAGIGLTLIARYALEAYNYYFQEKGLDLARSGSLLAIGVIGLALGGILIRGGLEDRKEAKLTNKEF